MSEAPLPRDEEGRLAALYEYNLLDTIADETLYELTQEAARVCGTKMATITLVDRDRQWFYARFGLEFCEVPRNGALCSHTILQSQPLVVRDAREDPRFCDSPAVTGPFSLRFYAGVPLINDDGYAIGTVCVMDTTPRAPDADQLNTLKWIGRQITAKLELLKDVDTFLSAKNFLSLLDVFPESIIISDRAGIIVHINKETERLFGYPHKNLLGKPTRMLLLEEQWGKNGSHGNDFSQPSPPGGESAGLIREVLARRRDGSVFNAEINFNPINTASDRLLVFSTIRDVSERVSSHKTMLNITRGTASKTGEGFFKYLATILAGELSADYITIAVMDGENQVRTIAYLADGKLQENIVYDLKDTPCDTTINESFCTIPERVEEIYSKDTLLVDMGVHAYVGVRLIDSRENYIGLINTMYRRPISRAESERAHFLLQLFSLRVSSELERIKTESALRKSEYSFKKVFNNSPFGILILDREGHIKQVNRSFYFMTRLKKNEVMDRTAVDMYDKTDIPLLNRKLEELANGKINNFKYETRLLRDKGDMMDVCLYGYGFKDENQELQNIVLQVENISQRKQHEEEIKKLSQSVELSPLAVLITDKNTVTEYVNPKYCELTGYREKECVGRKAKLFTTAAETDQSEVPFWNTIYNGDAWNGEFISHRKDGSSYWAGATVFPILNDKGEITNFVGLYEDISESKELSQQLSYRATHDELTGLLNRHEFERRLNHALDVAKVDNTIHSICFLDLDQFKVINDSSGHIAGDALLKQIGAILKNNVRSNDTIARLGGDEFGLLMENCGLEKARHIATSLQQIIENLKFVWEEKLHTVGVSIGIAAITGDIKDSVEIMKRVDTACYAAKNAGRNRIHMYSEDDLITTRHRTETNWIPEITAALQEDRFELFAQPIIPLRSDNEKLSYEILIRLIDTNGNMIPPNQFLSSAERYNLSTRIDRYVIDKLFRIMMDYPAVLETVDNFAVNLSGASISDNKLFEHIIELFKSTDVAPEKIRFELTETSAIANILEARSFMEQFKAIGCSIALDDFGSGLSSFAYLKNLPVDVLKLDGMFVADIVDDETDYAMVKMFNDLAHALGMETIAEYVENNAIITRLKEIGVDYAQGYAFSAPVSINEILDSHREPEKVFKN